MGLCPKPRGFLRHMRGSEISISQWGLYFVAVSFSYPCAGCSSAEPTYVSLNAATMIGSWSEVKLISEID